MSPADLSTVWDPMRSVQVLGPQKADFDDDHIRRLVRVHRTRENKKKSILPFSAILYLESVGLLNFFGKKAACGSEKIQNRINKNTKLYNKNTKSSIGHFL